MEVDTDGEGEVTQKEMAELSNRMAQYGSYVDPSSHERDCVEAAIVISRTFDLIDKAKALVDLMDDAERNHGSLVGSKTLRGVNELRLELSKWK